MKILVQVVWLAKCFFMSKSWFENEKMINFKDLDVPIVDKETKSDRISLLVDYFSAQKNNHRVKIKFK